MKVPFVGLSANIPDGWADESTLVFTMPADSSLAPSLVGKRNKPRSSANVTLAWEEIGAMGAAEYLRGRLETLRQALKHFKLEEEGALEGRNDAPFAVYRFEAKEPMMQLLCCQKVGTQVVCTTGTALTEAFLRVRENFLHVASSIAKE
jgi:hypothetical protein